MNTFCKCPTVNISQLNFWLVILVTIILRAHFTFNYEGCGDLGAVVIQGLVYLNTGNEQKQYGDDYNQIHTC